MLRVVLYGKPGCHLCDDMRDLVARALARSGVALEEVDITRDLDLYMRLRHDIPVLEIDGREVARHRVTDAEVAGFLHPAGIPASCGRWCSRGISVRMRAMVSLHASERPGSGTMGPPC
ncbi:MAG: glutaredoxin family protein [Vicinamibacterales bacterium]